MILTGCIFKKQDSNTWRLVNKHFDRMSPAVGVLKKGNDRNYTFTVTHLDEEFKLGRFTSITAAKEAAQIHHATYVNVTKEERDEQCKLEKEGHDERRRYESRAKIVRQLTDLYKNAVKNIADNIETLKDHVVTKGYRDGYHIMSRVMEAQGQVVAACHAIHILCRRDDGWKTFERDLLEEAARVYSGACSTSAMSNANDSAKGDALRNVSSTFRWGDTLEAAFSEGWDFEFSIKAMLPELFPEDKVTA